MSDRGPTTRSLDERIDEMADDVHGLRGDMAGLRLEVTSEFGKLRGDLGEFKAEARTQLGFVRWVGVFFAGVLVATIAGAGRVVWDASAFHAEVEQQGGRLEKVEGRLEGVGSEVKDQGRRLDRIDGRLDAMARQLEVLVGRTEPKAK